MQRTIRRLIRYKVSMNKLDEFGRITMNDKFWLKKVNEDGDEIHDEVMDWLEKFPKARKVYQNGRLSARSYSVVSVRYSSTSKSRKRQMKSQIEEQKLEEERKKMFKKLLFIHKLPSRLQRILYENPTTRSLLCKPGVTQEDQAACAVYAGVENIRKAITEVEKEMENIKNKLEAMTHRLETIDKDRLNYEKGIRKIIQKEKNFSSVEEIIIELKSLLKQRDKALLNYSIQILPELNSSPTKLIAGKDDTMSPILNESPPYQSRNVQNTGNKSSSRAEERTKPLLPPLNDSESEFISEQQDGDPADLDQIKKVSSSPMLNLKSGSARRISAMRDHQDSPVKTDSFQSSNLQSQSPIFRGVAYGSHPLNHRTPHDYYSQGLESDSEQHEDSIMGQIRKARKNANAEERSPAHPESHRIIQEDSEPWEKETQRRGGNNRHNASRFAASQQDKKAAMNHSQSANRLSQPLQSDQLECKDSGPQRDQDEPITTEYDGPHTVPKKPIHLAIPESTSDLIPIQADRNRNLTSQQQQQPQQNNKKKFEKRILKLEELHQTSHHEQTSSTPLPYKLAVAQQPLSSNTSLQLPQPAFRHENPFKASKAEDSRDSDGRLKEKSSSKNSLNKAQMAQRTLTPLKLKNDNELFSGNNNDSSNHLLNTSKDSARVKDKDKVTKDNNEKNNTLIPPKQSSNTLQLKVQPVSPKNQIFMNFDKGSNAREKSIPNPRISIQDMDPYQIIGSLGTFVGNSKRDFKKQRSSCIDVGAGVGVPQPAPEITPAENNNFSPRNSGRRHSENVGSPPALLAPPKVTHKKVVEESMIESEDEEGDEEEELFYDANGGDELYNPFHAEHGQDSKGDSQSKHASADEDLSKSRSEKNRRSNIRSVFAQNKGPPMV